MSSRVTLAVTDVEFSIINLHQAFLDSQHVLSKAVKKIFKRHFGKSMADDGEFPLWFVEMKAGFSDSMLKFMKKNVSGPWDIYALCSVLQRHFTQAVMHVLHLQVEDAKKFDAEKDATRVQLENSLKYVSVTRSWVSHGSGHASVAECIRAMQSLIEILRIIVPVVLPDADADTAIASIRNHIKIVETAQANLALGVSMSIPSHACLIFMRAMHQLREAAAAKVLSGLDCDIADDNGALEAIRKTGILSGDNIVFWDLVKKGRNYIFHGKHNNNTTFLLLCTCAVEKLLRFLCALGSSPDPRISNLADACHASAKQLMERMGISDVKTLVQAFVESHSIPLAACPYRGCLKQFCVKNTNSSTIYLRHLLSRLLPFECPPCSVKTFNPKNKARLFNLLRIVKNIPRMHPDGEKIASESDAVSWLLGRDGGSCLKELANCVSMSVPGNVPDVHLLFAAIKTDLLNDCCGDTGTLPADCSGWVLLLDLLPELEKRNVTQNDVMCCCASEIDLVLSDLVDDSSISHKEQKKDSFRQIITQHIQLHEPPEKELEDSIPSDDIVTRACIAVLASCHLRDRINKKDFQNWHITSSKVVGMSMRAAILEDTDFIAREDERAAVIDSVTSVMDGTSCEPRRVLLLHGRPGLGKSILATQALRRAQKDRELVMSSPDVPVEIVRGRGGDALKEDLVAFGRNLGKFININLDSPEDCVLAALKDFFHDNRYVLLIDDADKAGLARALEVLPVSKQRCAIIITSQSLNPKDVSELLLEAGDRNAKFSHKELKVFTHRECMVLMAKVCDNSGALLQKEEDLGVIFDKGLGFLPLAVRLFANWSKKQFKALMRTHDHELKKKMNEIRKNAGMNPEDQAKIEAQLMSDHDNAASAAAVTLLKQWTETASKECVLGSDAQYTRGLLGTVRLALLQLDTEMHSSQHINEKRILLGLLALCPSNGHGVWSLFDHELTFSKKYPHIDKPLLNRLSTKGAFAALARETKSTGIISVDADSRKISMHQLLQDACKRILFLDLEKFETYAQIAFSLIRSRARVHEKKVTPEMDAFWLEICDVMVHAIRQIHSYVKHFKVLDTSSSKTSVSASSATALTAQASSALRTTMQQNMQRELVHNMIDTIINKDSNKKKNYLQGVAMMLYKLGFHQRSFDIVFSASDFCSDELLQFRHFSAIHEMLVKSSKEGYLGYNWKQYERIYLEVAIKTFQNQQFKTMTISQNIHSGQDGSDWDVAEWESTYTFTQDSFDSLATSIQRMSKDSKSAIENAFLRILDAIREWAVQSNYRTRDAFVLSKRIYDFFGKVDFDSLDAELKEAKNPMLLHLRAERQLIHHGIQKHGENPFASGYIYESISDLHLCYQDVPSTGQGNHHFHEAIKYAHESVKCSCISKGKNHQRIGLRQMKLAHCLYRNREHRAALLYASLAFCFFEDLRKRRQDRILHVADWLQDCSSLITHVLKEMDATLYPAWLSTSFRGTEHTHLIGVYDPSPHETLYFSRLYQSVNGAASLCEYFTSLANKHHYSINLVPDISIPLLDVKNESDYVAKLDNLLHLHRRALQTGYFAVPISSGRFDIENFLVADERIRRSVFRAFWATDTTSSLEPSACWLKLCEDLKLPTLIEEKELRRKLQHGETQQEQNEDDNSNFSSADLSLERSSSFKTYLVSNPPVSPQEFDEMFNELYTEFRSKLQIDYVRRRFAMYFSLPSQIRVCKACRQPWELTAGEKAFYEDKNLQSPKKCKPCRNKRQAAHCGGGSGGFARLSE
jgi:hypothetical protein